MSSTVTSAAPQQRGQDRRSPLVALLLGVALVAILARSLVIPQMLRELPAYRTTQPGTDGYAFSQWAQEIVGGDWLGKSRGPFYQGPLYPYMLALTYVVAGPGDERAGIAMNCLFGVLAAVCAAGLGHHLFGRTGGLAAGFAMALNGSQMHAEAMLLVDSVLPLLWLAALWLVVALLHCERHDAPRPRWLWLIAGLSLGLAVVGRGSNLLPALALGAVVACPVGARRPGRALQAGLLLALGAFLMVAPVVLRNGLVARKWCITTNGPVNLYIGNAPGTTGCFTSGIVDKHQHRHSDGPYWLRALGKELRRSPWSLPAALGRKTLLFFNSWDVPNNGSYMFARRYAALLRFTLGPLLLYAIGFVGVTLTLRRHARLLPLWVFGLSYAASIIAVFVLGRYKLPFLALLTVFAGGAAVRVGDLLRARRWRALAGVLLLGVGFAVAFYPRGPVGGPRSATAPRSQDFVAHTQAFIARSEFGKAERMARDGLRLRPRHPLLNTFVCAFHMDNGRPEEALRLIERTARAGIRTTGLIEMRIVALGRLGRPEEALAAAREAAEIIPDSPVVRRAIAGLSVPADEGADGEGMGR